MQKRERYIPPKTIAYEIGSEIVPFELREAAHSLEAEANAPPGSRVRGDYGTVVNSERRFVDVSDSFCKLLGYRKEELIGKEFDYVTVPGTNDIPTVFCLFARLGYMHGLWMLRHRTGKGVLVRYEVWVRSDHLIQSKIESVRTPEQG